MDPWNYCTVDEEKCDPATGNYINMDLSDVYDYDIRNRLDEDLELVLLRPKAAVKKLRKTLSDHPDSRRAMYNLALAHHQMYRLLNGTGDTGSTSAR